MRGLLVTSDVPIRRSRAERFDDLVLDAVEHLEQRWSEQLSDVEFAVEDVPVLPPANQAEAGADVDHDPVPLTRYIPATGSGRSAVPARIVVYRRPLEARALDREDLAELVLDVIVHEVADMLGVEPEVIDPEGHGFGEEDEE
ncbi:MAG: metallopeptidase family protein [Frankia sp.]